MTTLNLTFTLSYSFCWEHMKLCTHSCISSYLTNVLASYSSQTSYSGHSPLVAPSRAGSRTHSHSLVLKGCHSWSGSHSHLYWSPAARAGSSSQRVGRGWSCLESRLVGLVVRDLLLEGGLDLAAQMFQTALEDDKKAASSYRLPVGGMSSDILADIEDQISSPSLGMHSKKVL